MWTKEALHGLIKENLRDYRLIVVSNREPYIHRYTGDQIECMLPAGGLAAALDPVMRAAGGVWIAQGSGDADRIDYTKGIPDRLRAPDRLLEKYPRYRKYLIFIQIGAPSRVHIPQYRSLDDEIDHLVEEINWKWTTNSWQPIIYRKQNLSPTQMVALHRLAHFCVVNSLHDGMNLVAKEFVASRFDGDGILILSQFAGAAQELTDALLVWAGKALSALLKFEFAEAA